MYGGIISSPLSHFLDLAPPLNPPSTPVVSNVIFITPTPFFTQASLPTPSFLHHHLCLRLSRPSLHPTSLLHLHRTLSSHISTKSSVSPPYLTLQVVYAIKPWNVFRSRRLRGIGEVGGCWKIFLVWNKWSDFVGSYNGLYSL